MEPEVKTRMDAAVRLAREAGERTLVPFREQRFGVERKPDGTEVTEVDRETERWLREQILAAFEHDSVFGEEHGEHVGTSGFRWVLDPIDGTASFVRGVPLYGTLVAVERERRSEIGVIAMPALHETVYAARGGGAWRRLGDAAPERARVSSVDRLADAMVVYTSRDYFERGGCVEALDPLHAACGPTRGWSDCYAHVLVATGRADAAVEPGIALWDVAPMTVIMEEAGGRAGGWDGGATAHTDRFVASNGVLHDELLGVLKRWA